MDPSLEARLRRAASKAGTWTAERDRLIVLAHNQGAGLREIARAVNMTHAGVRRIIQRDKD